MTTQTTTQLRSVKDDFEDELCAVWPELTPLEKKLFLNKARWVCFKARVRAWLTSRLVITEEDRAALTIAYYTINTEKPALHPARILSPVYLWVWRWFTSWVYSRLS